MQRKREEPSQRHITHMGSVSYRHTPIFPFEQSVDPSFSVNIDFGIQWSQHLLEWINQRKRPSLKSQISMAALHFLTSRACSTHINGCLFVSATLIYYPLSPFLSAERNPSSIFESKILPSLLLLISPIQFLYFQLLKFLLFKSPPLLLWMWVSFLFFFLKREIFYFSSHLWF